QLRQLLEQLNPDAAAERLLLVARPGAVAAAAEPAREPGLLSVLVSAGSTAPALSATLASIASQVQRPVQVVLATVGPADEAERAARPFAERAPFALDVLSVGSSDFAVRTNQGLSRARGQYLA